MDGPPGPRSGHRTRPSPARPLVRVGARGCVPKGKGRRHAVRRLVLVYNVGFCEAPSPSGEGISLLSPRHAPESSLVCSGTEPRPASPRTFMQWEVEADVTAACHIPRAQDSSCSCSLWAPLAEKENRGTWWPPPLPSLQWPGTCPPAPASCSLPLSLPQMSPPERTGRPVEHVTSLGVPHCGRRPAGPVPCPGRGRGHGP